MTIERFITLLMATFWYAIGYLWAITFSDLNWISYLAMAMCSLSIIGFLLTFYRG
jgi:hypothetical protein